MAMRMMSGACAVVLVCGLGAARADEPTKTTPKTDEPSKQPSPKDVAPKDVAPTPVDPSKLPGAPTGPGGRPSQTRPAVTTIVSEEFKKIVDEGTTATRIATGHSFTEGPLWIADEKAPGGGYLLYSDIPENKVFKWTPSASGEMVESKAEVFIDGSGHSNGLTLDTEGRILLAQHDGKVSYRENDGKLTMICDKHEGKRLNSPNDLCVRSDGVVFFTDPPYGLGNRLGAGDREKELEFCGVYRIKQDGSTVLLSKEMATPNGIALSPDEKTLYVADTSKGQIRSFVIADDQTPTDMKVFAELVATEGPRKGKSAGADGVRVDVEGNVYCAASGGAWVFDKTGKHLGIVGIPGGATNLCFGGKDRKTLFITGGKSVYAASVKIAGCDTPKRVKKW